MQSLGLELLAKSGAECTQSPLFGLPHWAEGLESKFGEGCNLKDFSLNDIWIIVANFTRMALFLAGLLSVVFIIIGGIMFITSAGNPDNVARARKILMNAAIGLAISILASSIIGYVASLF